MGWRHNRRIFVAFRYKHQKKNISKKCDLINKNTLWREEYEKRYREVERKADILRFFTRYNRKYEWWYY